jgi:hypothetical protein
MNAAAKTKIFGVQVGIDPKWLIGGLVGLAAVLFWYNSGGGEETPVSTAQLARSQASPAAAPSPANTSRRVNRRSGSSTSDKATLRLRAVDATRGDIDPTLRLDLLNRLRTVEPAARGRSLFEIGPAPQSAAEIQQLNQHIQPAPQPPSPVQQAQEATQSAMVNIPLKYYGFAKPDAKGENNKGLFLEGDNIVVATEGELVEHRYLVVELTANNARLEDTQIKLGQTLPVLPEAAVQ